MVIIAFLFWAIAAIRQTLLWVYWLQIKEYRFDRFQILFETRDGLEKLGVKYIFLKILSLLLVLFTGIYWPAIVLFGLLNIKFFLELLTKTLRIPVFTLRACELIATSLLGVLAVFLLTLQSGIIMTYLGLGELLLIIGPFLGIVWTTPLVNRSRKNVIELARKQLLQVRPTVIAITGSYGKSTTKDFLTHLLSQKFKTEKTPKNQNTDFGVARTASNLPSGTQMFVAEVGAYKIGEIESVVKFLKPNAVVITGIEPQHLSLFGSLENIKKAKFELVEGLREGGSAFFNGNDDGALELSEWAKNQGRRVVVVTTRILSVQISKVVFEVSTDRISKKLSAPICGGHFAQNLGLAAIVARKLGLSWEQIEESLQDISVYEQTMSVYKTKSGATVIDDSYNSTPKAFNAVLDYLKIFRNKHKIVVTSGILELGGESKKIHEEIGEKMTSIADEVYVTNSDFAKALKQTNNLSSDTLIYWFAQPDNIILFEGRMPSKVAKLIMEAKNE